MRLEQIPIFLGVLVAIIGLGLLLDAQLPDRYSPERERRRRERTELDRRGESLVGLGIVSLAAALLGTDRWRFGTIAVLVGAVLLAAGAWLNRRYLKERLVFRGPARRGEKRTDPARRAALSRPSDGAPGLADVATGRPPAGAARKPGRAADREAPIRVASEGVRRGPDDAGGDETPDATTRPRIR